MDFPVIEVQPDWSLEDEPMGSKEKFWVKLPNDSQPWLFKYRRPAWGRLLAGSYASLYSTPTRDWVRCDEQDPFFGVAGQAE